MVRLPGARQAIAPQWRKWRRPVTTMAAPAASTAATTSSSRFEPPGWMTALTPAARQTSTPSAKGKKASEADHRAPGPLAGLRDGQAGARDAVHLAGADAHEGAVAGEDDGVRLDVADDPPGEGQVGQLAGVGRTGAGDPPGLRVIRLVVRLGDAGAAPPALRTSRDGWRRRQDGGVLDEAQVGPGGQPGAGRVVEAGRPR